MNDFKSQMKEKIKIYSNDQYLDGYISKEFLTDDGDADIYYCVKDKDEIFDSRTIGDQKDLIEDFYHFIESKTDMLENDTKINLHIIGYEFNSKEQGMIKHMVKEHYAIELYKVQRDYREQKNKIIFMILTGIMCLVAYLLIYLKTDFEFFLEVFGLIFSFALWEGCDAYIYELSEIKDAREEVCQNLLINIDFNDVDINKK